MSSKHEETRKVLFLSSGETISQMFGKVIQALDPGSYSALVLNQDFYYGEDSSGILETSGIPTRSLSEYGAFDVRSVLLQEQPDVAVVGHAGGAIEIPFISACRSLGVPTLLLQDGIIGRPSALSPRASATLVSHMLASFLRNPRAMLRYLYFFRSLGPGSFARTLNDWAASSHIYAHERCSKVAVMGSYAKEIFTQLGYAEEDIVITGQPRFDSLTSPGEARDTVCRRLGIDERFDILLFAAPVFRDPNSRAAFIQTIARAIGLENLHLVVKIHPREDPEQYRNLLSREGTEHATVVTDFPVPDLLRACDLFLSHYSTMTLEALLVGRPVILLKADERTPPYPFDQVGVSISIEDQVGLRAAIREGLLKRRAGGPAHEDTAKFIREHANGDDGGASQRVAALISDICPEL